MKKLIVFCAAMLAAISAFSATYKQASQSWVEMRLAQMAAQIRAGAVEAATSTQSEEVVRQTASVAISDAYSIATTLMTSSTGIETNGIPYYVVSNVGASLTNAIPNGTLLSQYTATSFTNATGSVVLTEGELTNTISAVGLAFELKAPVGDAIFTQNGGYSQSVLAMKFFK